MGRQFDHIFNEHQKNRLIIATFASNVDRVQQIINTAYKFGRKVIVEGRSMVNIISIAQELGYINIPDKTPDRAGSDEKLSAGTDCPDHYRKSGRGLWLRFQEWLPAFTEKYLSSPATQ